MSVGILYQAGGIGAVFGHGLVTPYLSSRGWRHRSVQGLALFNIGLLVVYSFFGETVPELALALPVVAFVSTSLTLGVCNFMCALCARAVAPEAVGAITGLTHCIFTLGNTITPVMVVPLLDAGGLRLPCLLIAGFWALKVVLLTWCAVVPPNPQPTEAGDSISTLSEFTSDSGGSVPGGTQVIATELTKQELRCS